MDTKGHFLPKTVNKSWDNPVQVVLFFGELIVII